MHQLLIEAEEYCKLHSASEKSSSCCFFPCCCCALSSGFIAGSKDSKLDSTASCCKASRKEERDKKQKSFSLLARYDHCRASPLIFFHLSRSPLGCEQYQQANYILHIFQHYQLLLLLLQQQTHQSLILPAPFLFLFLFSPNNAANQCYERASERESPKCSS